MKIKYNIICLFACIPLLASAQWRIGVVGGSTYNIYTDDRHYLTDFQNEGLWGLSFGIAGQRDLISWETMQSTFGVKAEFDCMEKNIKTKKNPFVISVPYGYLQIPILASLSGGSKKIKGFVDAGIFGGWLYKGREEWKHNFDFGGAGGIGAEWNFYNFTLQAEARAYIGAVSSTKSDRSFKTPHYNNTISLQVGLFYNFK